MDFVLFKLIANHSQLSSFLQTKPAPSACCAEGDPAHSSGLGEHEGLTWFRAWDCEAFVSHPPPCLPSYHCSGRQGKKKHVMSISWQRQSLYHPWVCHACNHKVIVTCDQEGLILPSACNFNSFIFEPVLLTDH